jgi:predicted PurR-regulated permease PerM
VLVAGIVGALLAVPIVASLNAVVHHLAQTETAEQIEEEIDLDEDVGE